MIRVPNHLALDKADQLGFSLYFKAHQAEGTLVNYSLRSQKLSLTADNRILYEIQTDTGNYQLASDPIDLNQWHQVGAHYNNGQLQLEVNGILNTTPASGVLIHQAGTTAIRLGDNFVGQMNRFKVIDWTAPDLVVFDNGLSTKTATYDASGNYTTSIQSTGNMGNRTIAQMSTEEFKLVNFFIPVAYAQTTGSSLPMPVDVVNSNFPGGSESLYVSTRQNIQDGFSQLGESAKFLWDAHAESVKTVLTGADFIISFIPFVGDSKDLAIQAIYKLFDSADYDELVVIVATLGLAADGIGLIGAVAIPVTGGASAIVSGAAVTFSFLAKTIKAYTKVMPRALNKVLVNFFRKLYTRIKTNGWNDASNAVAFSALLYSILGDDELREMLYGMVQTEDDLFAWVDYIGDYVNQPDVVAENGHWLDFFISKAYAARNADDFVVILKNIYDELLERRLITNSNQLGERLTLLVKSFDGVSNPVVLREKFELRMLKALLSGYNISGEKGMRGVIQAYKGIRNDLSTYPDFLKAIIELTQRSPKVFRPGEISGSGLGHVFGDLASDFSRVSYKIQGAVHHIHAILDAIRRGGIITGIEVPQIIIAKAETLGTRIYDQVYTLNGKKVHSEAKSWHQDYILSNVKRSLKGRSVQVKDAAGAVIETKEKKGQMLLDFANLFNKKGDAAFSIEWQFDKRMTPEIKTDVVKLLKKEFKPDGDAAKRLAEKLQLDLNVPAVEGEWNDFLIDLQGKIPDLIRVVDNTFG